MKPLFFPGHNRILTGPQGLLDEEIVPLPALVGGGLIVSVWEPDEEERAAIAAGAPTVLGILSSETQPPVALCTLKPEDGLSQVVEAHRELLR